MIEKQQAIKHSVNRLDQLTKNISSNNKALGLMSIQPLKLLEILQHNSICLEQIEQILFNKLSKSLKSNDCRFQDYLDLNFQEYCRQLVSCFTILLKNIERWVQKTSIDKNCTPLNSKTPREFNQICQFCQTQLQQRHVERVYQQITNEPRLMQAKMLIEADEYDLNDEQQKRIIQRQIVSYSTSQNIFKSKTAKADTYLTSLLKNQQIKCQQLSDLLKAPVQDQKLQFDSRFINRFIQEFSESFRQFYTTSTRKTLQSIVKRVHQSIKKQLSITIKIKQKNKSNSKKEGKNSINLLAAQDTANSNQSQNQVKNSLTNDKSKRFQLQNKQLNNQKQEIRKAKTLIEDLRLQLSKIKRQNEDLKLQLSKLKVQNQSRLEDLVSLKFQNCQLRALIDKSKEETEDLIQKVFELQRKLEIFNDQNQKCDIQVQTQPVETPSIDHKYKSKKYFKSNRTFGSENSYQVQNLQRRASEIFSIAQIMPNEDDQYLKNSTLFKSKLKNHKINPRNSSNLQELALERLNYFNQISIHDIKNRPNGFSQHLPAQNSQLLYYSKQKGLNKQFSNSGENKASAIVKEQSANEKNQKSKIKRHSRVSQQNARIKQFTNARDNAKQNKNKLGTKILDSVKSAHYVSLVKNLSQDQKKFQKEIMKNKLNQFNISLATHEAKPKKLPQLNSCTIQNFHFSGQSSSLYGSLRENKPKSPSGTLRSPINLSKNQKLFTISDFDLLGGMSQSFKNIIRNGNKIQLTEEQLKLKSQIVNHILQLKKFKTGIYQKVLGFLENPWQTVVSRQVNTIKDLATDIIRQKIEQILIHHKIKCKQLPCAHLSLFIDKIGMPCNS